jgi:beta-lactamase class A
MSMLLVTLALLAAAPPRVPDQPYGEAARDCEAHYPLTRKNVPLTEALARRLDAAGYGSMMRRGRLGVSIVDLTPRGRIHYAGVNDDTMLYAASLPKIVALLGVTQAAKEGRLHWTPAIAERLDRMINDSSNPDADWAVHRVGLDYLEDLVRRPGYCFYGGLRGGLWVGRGYARGGPTHRDPLRELSHGATARQAARFYTLLDRGLLVGPVGSRRILGAMGPPRKHHKFVGALEDRPGLRFLARKSGTWRSFHSDSALIEHGGVRYVVVAIADHPRGAAAVAEAARIADDLIVAGAHRAPIAKGTESSEPPSGGGTRAARADLR